MECIMKKNKLLVSVLIIVMTFVSLTECAGTESKKTELTILAAASLTDVCNEIKELYETKNPDVTLLFSYAGSGALQTQIEEGAEADIFISAATKQMNALKEQRLMDEASVVELLENKVVLIVPSSAGSTLSSFEEIIGDEVKMIGVGEPSSVPAGQYAEEIFNSLGIYEEASAKANYGTDVRTVLAWVEEAEVDCGIVYATDAMSSNKVTVVCEAPEASCKKIIYPAGVIEASKSKKEATAFVEYLQTESISELFASYGFTPLTK